MKHNRIICRQSGTNGELCFYLLSGSEEYWLFNNRFKSGLLKFYGEGIDVSTAMNYSLTHNTIVHKIMDKLPKYIHYIEMVENIAVLKKTIKRNKYKYEVNFNVQ